VGRGEGKKPDSQPKRPAGGRPQGGAGDRAAGDRRPNLAGKPGKHTTSNSVLQGHLVMLSDDFITVSIDRLTVLGREKGSPSFASWVARSGHFKDVQLARFPYAWQYKAEEGLLQLTSKQNGAPEAMCSGKRAAMRFDFNPSKGGCELFADLLEYLSEVRVSRIDVAIDYHLDLSGYRFDRGRVKRREFTGADGRTETVYLGERGGRLMHRMYNKALEEGQEKSGVPKWRAEVEHRPEAGEEPLPLDLFEALKVHAWAPPRDLDWRTRADLFMLYHQPSAMRGLHSATRRRLKQLAEEHFSPLSPSPSEVYLSVRSALQAQLDQLMPACLGTWEDRHELRVHEHQRAQRSREPYKEDSQRSRPEVEQSALFCDSDGPRERHPRPDD